MTPHDKMLAGFKKAQEQAQTVPKPAPEAPNPYETPPTRAEARASRRVCVNEVFVKVGMTARLQDSLDALAREDEMTLSAWLRKELAALVLRRAEEKKK